MFIRQDSKRCDRTFDPCSDIDDLETYEQKWQLPLLWNAAAQLLGERWRIECPLNWTPYLGDFEAERTRLLALMNETPWLDWVLHFNRYGDADDLSYWNANWSRNVWFGLTIHGEATDQALVNWLVETPVSIKFLNLEAGEGSRISLKRAVKALDWICVPMHFRFRPAFPSLARRVADECMYDRCVVTGALRYGGGDRLSYPAWLELIA